MSGPSEAEIAQVRAEADCLYTPLEIERACDAMAAAITARIGRARPLLLAAMTGGMVPTAMLLSRLDFPLQVDYIHLTRYGSATAGGEIEWIRRPPKRVRGRVVLLIDDLLDRGLTLAAAVAECRRLGAREVLTAVLIVKSIPDRPGLQDCDFFGLVTPDRYLFGYGMDYKTYWRNGPGIFATKAP